jgi:predicted esterase
MYHVLDQVGTAKDPKRTLVFVRGFQGLNNFRRLSTSSTQWFNGIRKHGYRGQLLSFRWFSPWWDCRSQADRYARIDEAADALWELLQQRGTPIESISLMGFSQGGSIIQRVLRLARYDSARFRRVYLFGTAARRHARWPELLESVSEGLWNFHSEEDPVLQRFHPDAVGLYGLPGYYTRARDIDCQTFISDHDEWPINAEYCLYRARLNPLNL